MRVILNSPLFSPGSILRIDPETGAVFFLDEDFGEKPKDRNVGISPLQFASA